MAVGPEIESIKHHNLPSPEQVGGLAVCLVEFAERHDKLSSYGDQIRGENRKHIIKPMQQFEIPGLDIPDVYLLQSRTAAHLEETDSGVKRLRIFDSLVRKELGMPGGHGIRSVYDFTWTKNETIEARRRMVALPNSGGVEPMIDVVDRMVTTKRSPFRDDDAVAVYMMQEIDQLTADDTDRLAKDVSGLINQIDSGLRPYTESDNQHTGFIVRY